MKLQKLNCPNCNAELDCDLSKQKEIFCLYCRQKFFVDDENRVYTINKNVNINKEYTTHHIDEAKVIEAKTADYESKSSWKYFAGIMAFLIVMIVVEYNIPNIISTIETSKGNICAGSYEDYMDENYIAVVEQLETLGFENITTVDLKDSGLAFWTDGTVESVSIEGKTDFGTWDYFEPEAKIIIKYH